MMKNKQKRFGIRALLALVATVFMVGCYTKSDAPYDPNVSGKDPVYTATINVLDATTKAGVSGVSFNGITATGGTNGVYTFTPTTAGSYTFVMSKEGYEDAQAFIVFPSIGKDETITTAITVLMTPKAASIAATYKVSVIAKDAKTGATLENVTLAYGKRGATQATTEMTSGTFDFSAEPGIYDFNATKDGYVSAAASVLVEKVANGTAANEVVYNVVINMSQEVPYWVNGEVRDIETGDIITTGGKVIAVSGNEIVATKEVGANGLFTLERLSGEITLFFQFGEAYQALTMVVDEYQDQHTLVAYLTAPSATQTSAIVMPTTTEDVVLALAGGTKLTIPAATTIDGVTVPQVVTMSLNEGISSSTTATSLATMQFGPSGLQFSQPIELEYNFPVPAQIEDNLVLRYFNETTGEWEIVDEIQAPFTAPLTFELEHFSTYDVAIDWTITEVLASESSKSTWTSPVDIETSKFLYVEKVGVETDYVAPENTNDLYEKIVKSLVNSMELTYSYSESEKVGEGPAMTADQVLISTVKYDTKTITIKSVNATFVVWTTTTSTEVVNAGDHYALYGIQHGGCAEHGSAAQHGGGSGF